MNEKPEFYAKDLIEERLQSLSRNLLDVLDEAHKFSESQNATPWFIGTANYGLPQGMLTRMHENENYPWLTLANQTMDYTVRVGKTLVQFVVDDPLSPRKSHRLKRNSVERSQISFDFEDHGNDVPLIWRFYLNPMSNGVDYSPEISLLGFDNNENVICRWEFESIITGPAIDNVPESIEIDEPVLTVRKKNKQESNE